MRAAFFLILTAAVLVAPIAEAGGNMAVCIAIQQNFNNCAAQQQRQAEWNQWREWNDGDEPYYYGHRHWRRRPIDCTPWIYALKANNCF
jgi:hypothetical protein